MTKILLARALGCSGVTVSSIVAMSREPKKQTDKFRCGSCEGTARLDQPNRPHKVMQGTRLQLLNLVMI